MQRDTPSGREIYALILGVGGTIAVFAGAAGLRVASGIPCYGLGATLLILLLAVLVFAAGVSTAGGVAGDQPEAGEQRRVQTPGLDRVVKEFDQRCGKTCRSCGGTGCEWLNLPRQGGCMRQACRVCHGVGRK